MAQVILQDIVKVYPGGVKAVDRFCLEIADREFVVLVGPSGCGKSTTLRMIAGLEEITEGTIQIGDRVVNRVPPKDRDLAMVFQNYALYPHMTVRKNMSFGLKLRKVPKATIQEKVLQTAKMLGIEELLDRRPRALSGGQQQRVALGRAIVRNPACFLLDEPLSNLDAKLRLETRAEIKRLQQRLQTTTIYVTHDQEEAMTLGHRIVVMDRGVIQQCDPPLRIYRQPANRFVAGFIGSPPMNFLEGRILGRDGSLWFDEGSFQIRVPDWAAGPLAKKEGSPVVLGVRPQAISSQPTGRFAGSGNTLTARVTVIEPLGEAMDVLLATDRHERITARVDADQDVVLDKTQAFYLDLERIHFFDAGGEGMNLAASQQPA